MNIITIGGDHGKLKAARDRSLVLVEKNKHILFNAPGAKLQDETSSSYSLLQPLGS